MKDVKKVNQNEMDIIAMYMDDDIREELHGKLAPCTPEIFIREYCRRKPEFENVLQYEFSIEL